MYIHQQQIIISNLLLPRSYAKLKIKKSPYAKYSQLSTRGARDFEYIRTEIIKTSNEIC